VNGISCIAMHAASTDDVYTLSLIYYAYSLYGMDVTSKRNVLDRLEVKAVTEGQFCSRQASVETRTRSTVLGGKVYIDVEMGQWL